MEELLSNRTVHFLASIPQTKDIIHQQKLIRRARIEDLDGDEIFDDTPKKFAASFFQALTLFEIEKAFDSVIKILHVVQAGLPENSEERTTCTSLLDEWEEELGHVRDQKEAERKKQESYIPRAGRPFINLILGLIALVCWLLIYRLIMPEHAGVMNGLLYMVLPAFSFLGLGFFVLLIASAVKERQKKEQKLESSKTSGNP